MESKEVLEQLSEMKDNLSKMYDSLEVIRDNLNDDTKDGINKSRELITRLSNTLDYQADLIIFKDRNDIDNFNSTIKKIQST